MIVSPPPFAHQWNSATRLVSPVTFSFTQHVSFIWIIKNSCVYRLYSTLLKSENERYFSRPFLNVFNKPQIWLQSGLQPLFSLLRPDTWCVWLFNWWVRLLVWYLAAPVSSLHTQVSLGKNGQGIHWSMNLCEDGTLQKMGEISVDKANIKCFKCSNRV